MKKVLFTLSMLLGISMGAWADSWTDSGNYAESFSQIDETNKVITITSEAELALLAYKANSEGNNFDYWTVKLANDMDMSAHQWEPIITFSGFLNGEGHTISHLNVSKYSQQWEDVYVGLIGKLSSPDYKFEAKVANLTIKSSTIKGGTNTGAIVGRCSGIVEYCLVANDVTVEGDLRTGNFTFCELSAGGIAGTITYSNRINGCVSGATVKAGSCAGGIVGYIDGNQITIEDCLYFGNNISKVSLEGSDIQYSRWGWIVGEYGKGNVVHSYFTDQSLTPKQPTDVKSLSYTKEEAINPGKLLSNYTGSALKKYEYGLEYDGNFYVYGDKIVTIYGRGTADEPYLISSTDDWNKLGAAINRLNLSSDLYYQLTNDITVSTMLGINVKPFKGHFDGNGHTLTCDINHNWQTTQPTASVEYCAPFSWINTATIENLHVSGTIKGGMHSAGLVGTMNNGTTNSIINCWVDATVQCDRNNENADHGGGIVGHAGTANLTVKGCLFTGYVVPSTGEKPSCVGAIVGWADGSSNLTVEDCMEAGTYGEYFTNKGMNLYNDNSTIKTFAASNSYSTNRLAGAAPCYSIKSGKEGAVVNVSVGDAMSSYNVSKLEFYFSGVKKDGVFYTANQNAVSFTFTQDGMEYTEATAKDEAGNLVDCVYNNGKFMLIMPASNVIVTSDIITVALKDGEDNAAVLGQYQDKKVNVKLDGRTLYKDGSWNTLCLPFNIDNISDQPSDISSALTIKELESSSFDSTTGTLTLNFKDAEKIEAGKPYMVKWTSGDDVTNPEFKKVTLSSTTPQDVMVNDLVTFKGTYAPTTLTANDRTKLYLSADNSLYYPDADVPINSFRAYFMLHGITVGNASNQAHSFVLNFGDETDGIAGVISNDVKADGWFTLDGRRLNGEPTEKGIYIHQGRKVVVK